MTRGHGAQRHRERRHCKPRQAWNSSLLVVPGTLISLISDLASRSVVLRFSCVTTPCGSEQPQDTGTTGEAGCASCPLMCICLQWVSGEMQLWS